MSSQPARSRGRGRGTGGPSRARGENRGRGRGRGIGRGGGGDGGGGGGSGDGGPSGSPHLGLGGRGSGRGAGPSRGRGGPPAGGSRAPRDVCNFYWTTGSCTKAFDCTWKHIAQTNAPENAPPPEDIDFFSTEGLAINNGVVVDEQHKLKPSEAHNHLKAFLGDHYHFENTMRIDGFARIFASVNDRNKFWVCEITRYCDIRSNFEGRTRIKRRYGKSCLYTTGLLIMTVLDVMQAFLDTIVHVRRHRMTFRISYITTTFRGTVFIVSETSFVTNPWPQTLVQCLKTYPSSDPYSLCSR